MLPNRIIAIAIVGLLALQVLPGPANAQLTNSSDLVVESIDVGRVRVATVEAPVNITVKNIGTQAFNGATGWKIFVGYNGIDLASCIERGDNPPPSTSPGPTDPCFIVITTGNTQGNAVNIPAGESRVYTMRWKAERTQATTSAAISAEILPLSADPGQGGCSGPDSQIAAAGSAAACANNRYIRNGVFVGEPGVRAEPNRLPAPSATGGDKNTPWTLEELKANVCPEAPVAIERACKVRAGKTIAATYSVTNVGSVDDSYTPDLLGIGTLKTQGYTFDFAPTSFSLGAGERRDVRLTVFIPENVTYGNTTNLAPTDSARIVWKSTVAPTVSTATLDNPGCLTSEYCENPTLPTFFVDHRRAFNVTTNFTFDDMALLETSEYLINITNEGNADDYYNLTFANESQTINDSWTPRIIAPTPPTGFSSGYIAKGQNATFKVQITPQLNATNGSYQFGVRVKSFSDDGTSPCKRYEATVYTPMIGECIVHFTAHVKQTYDIFGLNDVAQRLVPGETATYNLGIRNRGNGYENVSLELQTTVFGWDVRLSNTTVRLTPYNLSTFSLTVTSPPNTPENTIGAFYVNATASGPQETPLELRSKASTESLMTVIRGPNIRLDAPMNTSFVDAGAPVEFNVLVTNTGNVADNFTIPTPERPADWAATVSVDHLELQPNQQGSVKVTLTPPAAATVGEKATAIVKALSTVDRSRTKSLALEARVSGPDLFVDNLLVNSTNPYTGDPLEVSVVLGNSGNKAHDKNVTLRLFFVQGGVERVIGEKTYPALFIGGQRRLTETFAWDTTGVEGAGILLARIDVNDNVKEIDDSAASNEKTRPITLRKFDIKITPAIGLSARPGEKLKYSEAPNVFVIRYDGNQESEPVSIRLESEHGWLASAGEISMQLLRGNPVLVTPEIEVPTIPGTAKDTITLTVIPSLRPDEVLRASTITSVIDEEKPIVRSISATPAGAKLGDKITIEVVVEDATGVNAATAWLTFPTNETSPLTLNKVAPDRFRGDRTFTVAGAYRVAAELVDAADPPNLNNTRLALGSFVVSAGSAPTVKLAAGQATTIRTGSPIKLDIRDPLGVGKASFSIKGVSYDLKGPGFQIDTSTFQAGNVELTVTAENIYGVATSQKFSFVVDNAPPGITRVTMNPERPRANQDVTLTVQTEAKVEAVDVLVKKDGQVVQTLNATKRGVGTFSTTFNPGEGDYRIDVTARDAAGNTKLAEGAVVFSAKPGSPFDVPAPGFGLLVLAAVAVALLVRRR